MNETSQSASPPGETLFISFEGLVACEELTTIAEGRAAWLRRRHRCLLGPVSVHLRRDFRGPVGFEAWATAQGATLEFVAHHASAEPELAMRGAFAELDGIVQAARRA